MNPSTLSALLLVTVCCFILMEFAVGEDNSATAEFDSPGFLTDNKAIRSFIKKADNMYNWRPKDYRNGDSCADLSRTSLDQCTIEANAIHEIHARMVATGLKKRAKKFMKKEQFRLEKLQHKRKKNQRKNDISRRTDQRSARSHGGNGGRGYGGYGGYRG